MRMRQKTKIKLMKIVFVCSIDRRISVVVCCHVLLLAMSECGSSFFLFLSRWFELAELFTPKSFIRFIHIFKRDLLTFPAMAEAVERESDEKIFSSLSIKNNSRSRKKKKNIVRISNEAHILTFRNTKLLHHRVNQYQQQQLRHCSSI